MRLCSQSNVIMMDEHSVSFHEYLKYYHTHGTIVFCMQSPSNKLHFSLLSSLSTGSQFAYLSMLFILVLTCTAGNSGQCKNKWQAQIGTKVGRNKTSKLKLDSYDGSYIWNTTGTIYMEHSGTISVTIAHILMEWNDFFSSTMVSLTDFHAISSPATCSQH